MCKLKSAIILKDRVFIPDYNHHSPMLEELGIEDSLTNAERLFVRAELSPKNGDVFSPIDTWIFTVDQDVRPDWFVESYEKERMVTAVKEWAKGRIHIGVDGLKINSGYDHYIKDCTNVEVFGSAGIKRVCGSASINGVCGSARINEVYDSARINYVCDRASIDYVGDSASINYVGDWARITYVGGSASINRVCGSVMISNVGDRASINRVCGSVTVASSPYGWANKDKVIISENATFKDNHAKILYQSGDWEVRIVGKED